MESALFDEPIPSPTPPFPENEPASPSAGGNPFGEPQPTKSTLERENRFLQAVSNKYGVGAIAAALAFIVLLTLSPSFVTDDDGKFSMQWIFVLSVVVFVAAVWGPTIWAWARQTWAKDTRLNLSPANPV